jgi:hypothetical protein
MGCAQRAKQAMQEALALIEWIERTPEEQQQRKARAHLKSIKEVIEPLRLLFRGLSLKVLQLPTLDPERTAFEAPEERPMMTLRSGRTLPGIMPAEPRESMEIVPLPTAREEVAQTTLHESVRAPVVAIPRNELITRTWIAWLSLYGNNMLRCTTELEIHSIGLRNQLRSSPNDFHKNRKIQGAIAHAAHTLREVLPPGPQFHESLADAGSWTDLDRAMQTASRSSPRENLDRCEEILYNLNQVVAQFQPEDVDIEF